MLTSAHLLPAPLQGQVASFASPLLQLLILAALLTQPVTLMPDFAVRLYCYAVALAAEPFFLWIETLCLIHAVLRIGRRVSRLVFDESAESPLIKSLIILLTIAIYCFAMRLLATGVSAASSQPLFT